MKTLRLMLPLLGLLACGEHASPDGGAGGGAATGGGAASQDAGLAPGEYERTMAGFPQRSYDLLVPAADGGARPLLVMLHGGGGNKNVARRTSCPGADAGAPGCLHALALTRGFVVAIPDGTGALLRTWNAGGGASGWQCVSGSACLTGVDERAYFAALFADVAAVVPLEPQRVYAAGLSNGGAMAHRLGCQFPAVAAIASVGSGNQWSTTQSCTRAYGLVEIHGTDDPCWSFDGGPASCADPNPGSKLSVPGTLARAAASNGCDGGIALSTLPDLVSDGTTTRRHSYACDAPLDFYEVVGGGHTWPGGAASGNGATAQDWSANPVILDFFQAR